MITTEGFNVERLVSYLLKVIVVLPPIHTSGLYRTCSDSTTVPGTYICMYVCMVLTCSKSTDQPGKVANPACGQLNRENEYFPVPVRA